MSGRPLGPQGGARRGAVLPLVCILLVALLGAAALAIDLGRLYQVRQEVQTAADAAALAAMRAKQYDPVDYRVWAVSNAQNWAIAAAARNRAAGAPAVVTAANVVPVAYDPATRAITAAGWTANTSAIQVTAQASPTYVIGRAVGLTPPVVRRTATAWLASVNGGACVRPLVIGYTRFYEEGVTHDRRYSDAGALAPDFSQWDVSSTLFADLPRRTFTVLPPGESEAKWDSLNFQVHANWRGADLSGGGTSGFTSAIGAPQGSGGCAGVARVGDLKPSLNASDADQVAAAGPGMIQLCNRYGNAPNAWCYNENFTVGVKTRIMIADSVEAHNGGGNGNANYAFRVREVGVARIMCYFQSPQDQCNPVQMTEREANGTWRPLGPATGYPAGTMIVLIDAPSSTPITRDVVLGNKPGLSQRLLLVR